MTYREIAAPIIARVIAENAGKEMRDVRRALRQAYPWSGPRKWERYRRVRTAAPGAFQMTSTDHIKRLTSEADHLEFIPQSVDDPDLDRPALIAALRAGVEALECEGWEKAVWNALKTPNIIEQQEQHIADLERDKSYALRKIEEIGRRCFECRKADQQRIAELDQSLRSNVATTKRYHDIIKQDQQRIAELEGLICEAHTRVFGAYGLVAGLRVQLEAAQSSLVEWEKRANTARAEAASAAALGWKREIEDRDKRIAELEAYQALVATEIDVLGHDGYENEDGKCNYPSCVKCRVLNTTPTAALDEAKRQAAAEALSDAHKEICQYAVQHEYATGEKWTWSDAATWCFDKAAELRGGGL